MVLIVSLLLTMGAEGSHWGCRGFSQVCFKLQWGGVLQKNGLGCVVWLCCLEQDEEVQDEAKKEKTLNVSLCGKILCQSVKD